MGEAAPTAMWRAGGAAGSRMRAAIAAISRSSGAIGGHFTHVAFQVGLKAVVGGASAAYSARCAASAAYSSSSPAGQAPWLAIATAST